MRGAVAAGHPLTAEAGANVLRAGGNAVDACIGAAFTSWVCESMLTGPGGGAFLLAGGVVFDGFVAVPRARSEAELIELAVDFDGETAQHFRTGAGAVAVPGTALALEAAHARFGSVAWGELVEPAARLARSGVVLTETQAYLHAILDPLLRHSPEGDAFYGRRLLRAGDRLVPGELADTLDLIAADGARVLYDGELARAIVAHVPLSLDDLAAYHVVEREPLVVSYREHDVLIAPSMGGELIGVGLRALAGGDVLHAMGAMEAARIPAAGGTTHISVVDANGDTASLSTSLGSGSGVVVPGTGIHLNNMLGEADLVAHAQPGERLTSMMAPSLVLKDGRPRLVLGSAGSERLRGAVLQVVVNVVARGMDVEAAVDAPRLHLADGIVHVEPGIEYEGENVVRWREKNLYFGGVSAVEVRADGTLAAAGDPRRGGAGMVVA